MGSTVYKAFFMLGSTDSPSPLPSTYHFFPPDRLEVNWGSVITTYEMVEVRTNNKDQTITYVLGDVIETRDN
jgi:hypothetical protein